MRTGGSPVGVGAMPTVTTLTLLSRRKATRFRIILWRCWRGSSMELLDPERAIPGLLLLARRKERVEIEEQPLDGRLRQCSSFVLYCRRSAFSKGGGCPSMARSAIYASR